MAFFVNPNNSNFPQLLIYDIEQETEVLAINLTKEPSLLSEVLVVNGKEDTIVFEHMSESTEICLFNL